MFFNIENLKNYSNLNCVTYYKLYKKDPKVYLYQNIIDSVEILNSFLIQYVVKKNTTIGLLFGHNPVIVPLILSILNCENSFYFVCKEDFDQSLEECQRRGILFILTSDFRNEINKNIKNRKEIIIFETIILLCELYPVVDNNYSESSPSVCYCAETSGSTGIAKYIRVPYQCIMPNIESLIKKFQLNSTDRIVIISPTTFDPFIVDLFMGLSVGADNILLDNSIRLSHSIVTEILFRDSRIGPTFMQCTPSYFKLFGLDQISKYILADSSSLKTLVLGGEKFPAPMEIHLWNTQKNIFNIYGITEVSCWATIEKWDANMKMSLGDPIDESTQLDIRDEELYIGSRTRICAIENEPIDIVTANKAIFRATGDRAVCDNGRYYFHGRCNDSIKRFGIKINLSTTENKLSHLIPDILELKLIYYEQEELVLFYKTDNKELITVEYVYQTMAKHFKNFEIPNDIIPIDTFPLSTNGKLSSSKLNDLYHKKTVQNYVKTSDFFLAEIQKLCNGSYEEDLLNLSFISQGGNSFMALNILMAIEKRFKISAPKLLTILLDQNKTINDCLIYLDQMDIGLNDIVLKTSSGDVIPIISSILSKFDLVKCVDSTPSIMKFRTKLVLSIGSHAGLILNIELPSNKIISKLQLTDRIESEIVQLNEELAVFGCYDGYLYCFNVLSGETKWKFQSHGMIKCRPLATKSGLILFGNYNSKFNFYCVNGENGELCYKRMIGSKSIISNPVLFFDNFCIVCTLDGTCEVLNFNSGLLEWRVQFKSPIFSTPAVLGHNCVLVAEVEGIVHCLDGHGNPMWNFTTNSNIFSSFEIYHVTISQYLAYFGCYNKKVYCLEYDTNIPNIIVVKWESNELNSPIYSTPKLIEFNSSRYILVVTTTGTIYLFDAAQCKLYHQLTMPGEIFSTPAVIQGGETLNSSKIAIGCRDNYLYLINYSSIK